jgi:hypothetical protein
LQLKDTLARIELHGDSRAHPSLTAHMPPVAAVIFDLSDMVSIDPW